MTAPLEALLVPLGALLVVLGMADVFLTVLHYDGSALLGPRVNRGTWWAVRTATAPLPRRLRSYLRCLGAPLMIPVSLAVWLSLEVVGFALLFHPGLQTGQFDLPDRTDPGFGLALYTSIVTLSTLGYGDVTPTAPLFQALTGIEALIGFALLTLTISYILNVYSVMQHVSLLGAELQQQPVDPADPHRLLAAHLTTCRSSRSRPAVGVPAPTTAALPRGAPALPDRLLLPQSRSSPHASRRDRRPGSAGRGAALGLAGLPSRR